MKFHAGAVLAVLLLTMCRPSLAQEQRPSIRMASAPAAERQAVLVKSYGPGFPEGARDETVGRSAGCLIGGAIGAALALAAGGQNLVNVIAGGEAIPANPVVLFTGLIGVVFASFCSIGQALTPLYLYYFPGSSEEHLHTSLPGATSRPVHSALSR
ncbi:MAG: hypothetical protein EXQ95_09345 [Alphaproteobacteria bacterium]|nr:hypothetical protein [Alphaproteobacteria bacterium]